MKTTLLQKIRTRPKVISRLKRNFQDLETAFLNVARKMLKEIAEEFILNKALPAIKDGDLSRINSLDINLKDWQNILFNYLRESRRAGRLTGITEALELKQHREQQQKKKFLESSFTDITDSFIQEFVSALNFGNKYIAESFAVVPYDALRVYNDYSLYLTGVTKQDLLNKAKQNIYSGLHNGLSVNDMAISVSNVFTQFSQGRLQNIARTEVSKAMNQGRLEAFKASALQGFITAVEFTAILDDRVTDICEERNGLILSIDDPRLTANTPPLHFQCRSTLIPVDKFSVMEEGLEKKIGVGWDNIQQPMEGFGGVVIKQTVLNTAFEVWGNVSKSGIDIDLNVYPNYSRETAEIINRVGKELNSDLGVKTEIEFDFPDKATYVKKYGREDRVPGGFVKKGKVYISPDVGLGLLAGNQKEYRKALMVVYEEVYHSRLGTIGKAWMDKKYEEGAANFLTRLKGIERDLLTINGASSPSQGYQKEVFFVTAKLLNNELERGQPIDIGINNLRNNIINTRTFYDENSSDKGKQKLIDWQKKNDFPPSLTDGEIKKVLQNLFNNGIMKEEIRQLSNEKNKQKRENLMKSIRIGVINLCLR